MANDDPNADVQRFERLLAWSYRGEVAGEVLFERLAIGFEDTGHRNLFEALAELERLMADALRFELERYEVDGGDDDRSRARGDANAAAVIEGGWDDFLTAFDPITEDALAKYVELRAVSHGSDQTWDLLIAHEEAIQAVGRMLASDDGGDLQAPVNQVLARLRAHLAAPAQSGEQ